MEYNRPEIDTENLRNDRLLPEEYSKVKRYVNRIIEQQREIGGTVSDDLSLSDSIIWGMFQAAKELYSFLDTLPQKDIVEIMRKITLEGDLEKEVEMN